ncbi:DUF1996 domain-containing protein [Streptomyces sp. NPDC051976]|uniref:DUF1996 domain-containing protein n=1 Tax=Streptomyces sp. NPDC051976 TaxID=3154947 RepID=UPI00341B6DA6
MAAAALLIGGGGTAIVAANAHAGTDQQSAGGSNNAAWTTTMTVSCPDVGDNLRNVPSQAQLQVSRGLSQLDAQVMAAYGSLNSGTAMDMSTSMNMNNMDMSGSGSSTGSDTGTDTSTSTDTATDPATDPGAATGDSSSTAPDSPTSGTDTPSSTDSPGSTASSWAILSNLQQQRQNTIGQMVNAIGQYTAPPTDLTAMSACHMQPVRTQTPAGGSSEQQTVDSSLGSQGQNQAGGPVAADFADIRTGQRVSTPRPGPNASTGTFTSRCGTNADGSHQNPDNVIVTPGVSNGAHHMHDYVGNKTTDANSTNDSLAASDTTCTNGDQSTYYWPVVRVLDGKQAPDANAPGGGQDMNKGTILEPQSATIRFRGNAASKVTSMPRFLRIITGDAKALTNGPANANASWSCTGFENRQLKDKYPICPRGSDVVRTFSFANCWDGQNIDSANHRTHVVFAQKNGSCPAGFRAIPQLTERLTYAVPSGTPFAVDSFPEQLHKPVTDHADFINVMTDSLMSRAVRCINSGRACR